MLRLAAFKLLSSCGHPVVVLKCARWRLFENGEYQGVSGVEIIMRRAVTMRSLYALFLR